MKTKIIDGVPVPQFHASDLNAVPRLEKVNEQLCDYFAERRCVNCIFFRHDGKGGDQFCTSLGDIFSEARDGKKFSCADFGTATTTKEAK